MAVSNFDVIVIGAGVTGLTAAKEAVQSGLKTANIEALMFGGLVVNINELDGEPAGSGTDYASNLMMEISELGVENLSETVSAIASDGKLLSVTTDAGTHRARAVIIASGAKLKRLGIPGEMEFEYKGVSQCADCDGPMYKGEDVVVVGGGDSALQEALVLAEYAKQVHLVHRGARFRARQHLVDAGEFFLRMAAGGARDLGGRDFFPARIIDAAHIARFQQQRDRIAARFIGAWRGLVFGDDALRDVARFRPVGRDRA